MKITIQYISTSMDSGTHDFFESFDRKRFQMEYKLFNGFFEFAEKNVEEKKRLEYIKDLKGYLDYASTIPH